MIAIEHPLPAQVPGTRRSVTSWHFGNAGSAPKAYIQAGLHADEWPPMLVAHHLKHQLMRLEKQHAITGEIVLVPMVNPIGLAQQWQGHALGRFDLLDGRNFNRGYPYLSAHVQQAVEGALTQDAAANVVLIRRAIQAALTNEEADTEARALKKWAMTQAADADILLDLHCDTEAVMHIYTGTPNQDRGMQLARLMQAEALIVAHESGDHPFDEALARVWWETAAAQQGRFPVPAACFAATVELRGQADMDHATASHDAAQLIQFLALQGLVEVEQAELPAPRCVATALEAVEPLTATQGGLVVHLKPLGARVEAGEPVIELVDPLTDVIHTLRATYGGVLFARTNNRFVTPGTRLAKIAGSTAFRHGALLSE